MKFLFTVLASLMFTQLATAEVPQMLCSYKDVKDIASYSQSSVGLLERDLDDAETAQMESYFDSSYDCDEGVVLEGAIRNGQGSEYVATCWRDSLGSQAVRLTLDCQEQ